MLRKEKSLSIAKILIKLALVVIGTLGIILTFLSSSFMGGRSVFLYFTIQSNITIILISTVFLINDILILLGKKSFINQVLLSIKYIFTIAITITFVVFFTMLAPLLGVEYLISFNNISLHALVPILAIIDFFWFDYEIQLNWKKSFFGCLMPLYYVFFVYIGVPLGFMYAEDTRFPYFFLDYETYGFLFEKSFGVICWIFVLLIGICGLCLLFNFLMKLRKNKIK